MSIASKVILDELEEQGHPEKVEDVIFWALDFYAQNKKDPTLGRVIAASIVDHIKEEEEKIRKESN